MEEWRESRRSGMLAIAASGAVAAALWFAIRFEAPIIAGMTDLAARMAFTLKLFCLASLFCLMTGVNAVAHERLQSAAFDPLLGHETRRLRVNLRYLQNTLEQLVLFAAALFGLALYCVDGESMRAVEATAAVWLLSRLAFWAGYHKSAAMRGIGAPGMAVTLIALVYVGARIGDDLAGRTGAIAVVALYLGFEALLFWGTREDEPAS